MFIYVYKCHQGHPRESAFELLKYPFRFISVVFSYISLFKNLTKNGKLQDLRVDNALLTNQ